MFADHITEARSHRSTSWGSSDLPCSEVRVWSWWLTEVQCSALSLSESSAWREGDMSSGSFAYATTLLLKAKALDNSELPTNPLRADSHLSAMWRENCSHEVRMLQSTEIPQWTTQVYSGRIFVTPHVNKKIPSLSANLATQVREPWETDEKIMSPPVDIPHSTLTTFKGLQTRRDY